MSELPLAAIPILSPKLIKPIDTTIVGQYLLLTVAIMFITWLLQYHWNRRRLYMLAAKFPGPLALPIIGNAYYFVGSNESILKNINGFCDKYDKVYRVWLGHRLFFGIFHPRDLETIFCHPKAQQKEDLYKFARVLIGTGIFTAPVEKWRRHRKIIRPTFNQRILDSFVEVFAETSETMAEVLKDKVGKDIDIFELTDRCTLDNVCETGLGIKSNAQMTDNRYVAVANTVMSIVYQRMFKIWYHSDFIFNLTSMSRTLTESVKEMHEYTSAVVTTSKLAYQKQKEEAKLQPEAEIEETGLLKRRPFLELLIELSDQGANFTDEELREEVDTFMIAGSDTTATTMCYVFQMLGMFPDVQQKVLEEVLDVIGPTRRVEYTDLPHLKYVERVLKETMRLFPVGPAIVRQLQDDITLESGLVLPKDSSTVMCILHVHRNPRYWPNPLKFNADRFLPEECAKRHPFCWIPFSAGPRNCIGMKYGMMAMKTLTATLIRKYVFHCEYKRIEDIRLKQDLVLKPVEGYKVSVSFRN